jgi:hypothetical protein
MPLRFHTEQEFQTWLHRKDPQPPAKKRSKWGNIISREDGFTFDSRAELERYHELRWLEKAGKISNIRVHPRWKFNGVKTYESDFSYEEDGQLVIEDVKNPVNALESKFRRNCKLMLEHYQLTVRVIIKGG